MSEKLNDFEVIRPKETSSERSSEQIKKLEKEREAKAEKARHEHKEHIGEILSKVEESSKKSSDLLSREQPEKPKENEFVGSDVKSKVFKQTMTRVRKDLKPYQRPLSKFIHNDTVEKLSEAGASTVARPSGLLVGGITSLAASVAVYAGAKYYGYEYSYFVSLASFGGGFLLGVVGEMLIKSVRR